MRPNFLPPLAVLALCAWAANASAASFVNGTGLVHPDQTITFDITPAPVNNSMVNQSFESLGVVFNGAWINPDTGSQYANMTVNRIGNFKGGGSPTELQYDFRMTFSTHLKDVGFALVTEPGTTDITAYLDGIQVAQALGVATRSNDPINYIGFTGIEFNEISLDVHSTNRLFMLDNLQTAAVPEPSSSALAVLGLGVIARLYRRRKP